jgi:transposase
LDICKRAHEVRTAAYLLAKLFILDRLRRDEEIPVDMVALFYDVVAALGHKPMTKHSKDIPRRVVLKGMLSRDFPRNKSDDDSVFSVATEGFCCNWRNYEADKYKAHVENHIKANFSKCMFAFAEAELSLNRRDPLELATIKGAVADLQQQQHGVDNGGSLQLPYPYALPLLLLEGGGDESLNNTTTTIDEDIETTPLKYLGTMLYMCSRLEFHGHKKLFSVLPVVRSNVPGHTLIDSDILMEHLPKTLLQGKTKTSYKSAGRTSGTKRKDRTDEEKRASDLKRFDGHDAIWGLVLRTNDFLQPSCWRFNGMIQTDGYACTLYMKKHDDHSFKGKYTQYPRRSGIDDLPQALVVEHPELCRVVGVDPGKNNLIFCLEDGTPHYDEEHRKLIDRGRMFRYTKAQRDFEMGKTRRRKKAEDFKRKHCPESIEWETRLRGHNAKTTDVGVFVRFIEVFLASREALRPFYCGRLAHRRDRFESYRLKQKSETKLIANFKERMHCKSKAARTRLIIAFGDGSRNNLKNSAPAPSSSIRRLFLRHHFNVLDIHEAYTSKRCFHCKNIAAENGVHRRLPPDAQTQRSAEIWGVRRCCMCARPWSRDYHACLNIALIARHILQGLQRPAHPCRGVVDA